MRNYALKDLGERDRRCGKCGEDEEKYTRCKWCGIVRVDKSHAVLSNSTDGLYSHEDMVRLCDEAKRDQRHACAEALTQCNRYKEFGNYLRFGEAHQAIMNEAV